MRVPFTSPTWNFPGFYSFEVDFAEREEWYSQNTSAVLPSGAFPFQPAAHSQYNAQKPKVSVRWQPLDPKYIGALTLRGSYTEAFHAPALSEISPASTESFTTCFRPIIKGDLMRRIRIIGNPNLQPEVAYEWSYGAVYNPKWFKGLTLSADWWHIDMRSIASLLGTQFIVENNLPGLVIRGPPGFLVNRDQSSWSLIPTKILQARFLKVSTTKRSIFWTLRSLATEILAD